MAELFDVDVRTVSEHWGNVYSSAEPAREATVQKLQTARPEDSHPVTCSIDRYVLHVIISVGHLDLDDGYQAECISIWLPGRATVGAWETQENLGRNTSKVLATARKDVQCCRSGEWRRSHHGYSRTSRQPSSARGRIGDVLFARGLRFPADGCGPTVVI